MRGLHDIVWQNEHAEAERILRQTKTRDVDRDYLIRQKALDDYLRAKYNSPTYQNLEG
jgi:hypothetical protein